MNSFLFSIQVATLWCIVGLGIVCAVNAHGFFRQLISWFVVIAVITVAAFFSYLSFESVQQEFGLKPKAPIIVLESNTSSSSGISSSSSLSEAEIDSLSEIYVMAEKQLSDSLLKVSDSILSFPKWQDISLQGIEKRELFESKALFLRNTSMNYYRQIRSLSPPENKRQAHEQLLTAADNIRLAGYEVHKQFADDADSTGESLSKARERASQAKAIILTEAK